MTQAIHAISAFRTAPLFLLITAFLMLQALLTDAYLAPLPGLASGFGVVAATAQLTLSSFVIGFGGVQIAARLLQALGCCPALIIARAIVSDASPPEDNVLHMTTASTWLSVAPLLALMLVPILGSYRQANPGWRSAFFVHAGSLYPMTIIASSLGTMIFASTRRLQAGINMELPA